jgi:hypothetical protein
MTIALLTLAITSGFLSTVCARMSVLCFKAAR